MSSSVFKWPDRAEVDRAVRSWAAGAVEKHPEVQWLAYFGSYARGDWGVGSDLDLIAVIAETKDPFHRRPLTWDLLELPVPAQLIIYTVGEWGDLERERGRFVSTVGREAVTLFRRQPEDVDR